MKPSYKKSRTRNLRKNYLQKNSANSAQRFWYAGRTFHVYRGGCSDGEPVLFIHGLSGSRHWWRHNITALQDYSLYVLELPGYGRARGQCVLPVRENAELVADWITRQNLGPIRLIGHSMGGQIGLHVAAKIPDHLEKLVLVDSSGLLTSQPSHMALRLPLAVLQGKLSFVPRVILDGLRAGIPNLWRNTSDLLTDSLGDTLPRVRTPTLLIWGTNDVLVPKHLGQELAQELAAHLTSTPHYVLLPAGHVAMVDASIEFNSLVRAFFADEDLNHLVHSEQAF